jgi:putative PIN family toxin of toxin-antitoxin system
VHSAVIDTNVVIAGLRSRRGASFRVLDLIGDPRWEPVISVPLILEYESVAKRSSGIADWIIDAVVDMFCAEGRTSTSYFRWRPLLRDPSDEFILDLAVSSQCDYIVTYNTKDFVEASQFGIKVLTPFEFLTIIGEKP